MIENVLGFTEESGALLKRLMNEAYPLAQIDPTQEEYSRLEGINLPDEDDRHVLAAALAAEADILCTSNVKDFPRNIASSFGITIMTPDELLHTLIMKHPDEMLIVHNRTLERLRKSTNDSTLEALEKAGAPVASKAMSTLLWRRND